MLNKVFPAIAWFGLRVTCHYLQPYAIAAYLTCGWLSTVFYMKAFKRLQIFYTILRSVLARVFLIFSCIIIFLPIGLACALVVLLEYPPELMDRRTVGEQIVYMAAKLAFNLNGFAEPNMIFSDLDDTRQLVVQLLYLACVIITSILVMNLVIAMMNDRYMKVKQREKTFWRVRTLRRAVRMKYAFPALFGERLWFYSRLHVGHHQASCEQCKGLREEHPDFGMTLYKLCIDSRLKKRRFKCITLEEQIRADMKKLHSKFDSLINHSKIKH